MCFSKFLPHHHKQFDSQPHTVHGPINDCSPGRRTTIQLLVAATTPMSGAVRFDELQFGLACPTDLTMLQGDKDTEHISLLLWTVSSVETFRPGCMQLQVAQMREQLKTLVHDVMHVRRKLVSDDVGEVFDVMKDVTGESSGVDSVMQFQASCAATCHWMCLWRHCSFSRRHVSCILQAFHLATRINRLVIGIQNSNKINFRFTLSICCGLPFGYACYSVFVVNVCIAMSFVVCFAVSFLH